MVYMCVICVSRHLKEELAWATDKQFQVIRLIKTVSYNTEGLKNKAVLNLKQYCMCCYVQGYVVLSNVF